MSKKRTSAEASKDEQTSEGSDSVVQQEDNAKRAKLTLLSDTTLEDLPMELIECILVKAVAMEVKGMKLAKSVWKEKADPVINRLRTVCSQWNSICATNFFRNEVHRTLDRTAQDMIRMEILHQSPIQSDVFKAATLKDEMFMMCSTGGRGYVINVYDRNNMADVKDVIPLPGINPENMMACSVSNCLYVVNLESHCNSLLRIVKDEKHQFNISPWISDIQLSFCGNPISVSVNGSLIIISDQHESNLTVISIYSANGSLQHKLMLSPEIYGFCYVDSAIQKSNGNLVLVSYTDIKFDILKLLEIDMTGSFARQYQPSYSEICDTIFTDSYGRILLTGTGPSNKYELLDSEFNLMDFTGLKLKDDQFLFASDLSYNSETNEAVIILEDEESENGVLTIFRFTEE